MTIMSNMETPEARELSLVGKVEMRIALANDASLSQTLKTYLAPLLLKLASDFVGVRNKVSMPYHPASYLSCPKTRPSSNIAIIWILSFFGCQAEVFECRFPLSPQLNLVPSAKSSFRNSGRDPSDLYCFSCHFFW